MTIAELFVSLGVKGDDKANKALKQTKGTLGEIGTSALAVKAALVGIMYGMQRLFAASSASGSALTNFNATTGLSFKQLQQWQYAARQAGVSSEEFTSSVHNVQGAMIDMLRGKGAPEGMAALQNKVGLDPKRVRDTFYVMEKLQEFARKMPADVSNSMLKSFGLNENTIAAMRRGVFNPKNFKAAPTYSDREVGALDRANVAWGNLGNKIEMAVGRFNAKHGGQLVSDISKIVDQVVRLTEAFTKLSEQLKLFQLFGKVFEGWTLIFQGLSGGVEDFTKTLKGPDAGKKILTGTAEKLGEVGTVGKMMIGDLIEKISGSQEPTPQAITKIGPLPQNVVTPKVQAPSTNKQSNIQIKQDLHFQHEGKDAKRTGESVKGAVEKAFRQMSTQGQAS